MKVKKSVVFAAALACGILLAVVLVSALHPTIGWPKTARQPARKVHG